VPRWKNPEARQFAGTAAKGVHGLAYANDTATPDLVGGFYGSR